MSHLQAKPTRAKLWAILPAAGAGRRFSESELKQYQHIHGKTVLEHTVARLNQLPLAGYVLALAAGDDLAPSLMLSHPERVHFCVGGQERVDSVLNALKYLTDIADVNDWVLVHDAARPCVHIDSLNSLIDSALQQDQAAILATPVRDTLKRVNANQLIAQTQDRSALWQAQTPQIAKLSQLISAIEQALQARVVLTDEASALEYVGQTVHVVPGRADNIKITYPEDLALASLILQTQQAAFSD
jgi:2-C-methyl-D-erythritol 4-phosphate cytidylyltransferase